MHMLNMRIIGIIMQLAEYEVFMPMDPFLRAFPHGGGFRFNVRIVAPTIPLVNTKCALLYDFPLFGVFCGIFYLLLPFFKHTDEVNEKIGVLHVAQRFDRALAVCLDDALAAVET